MPFIIALYALAGALATGGALGGKYVYDVAQREAARDLLRRDRQALAEALAEETNLAELRRRAESAGVDPDVAEQGYLALRDGRITLDELLQHLSINAT